MSDWIRERLRGFGDATAISAQGGIVTYAELDVVVENWLNKLTAAGIAPGMTIAVVGDFSPGVAAFRFASPSATQRMPLHSGKRPLHLL